MKGKYYERKSNKIKWTGNRIVGCQSTNHAVCKVGFGTVKDAIKASVGKKVVWMIW